MHLVLQYPIVDFRPALKGENSRLGVPSWPQPDMQRKPFIRHFGKVEARKRGGSDDFGAEEYFCNAHLSIRYNDLHKQGYILDNGLTPAIFNSYRRLYCDGYFFSKVELGFVDNTEKFLTGSAGLPLVSYLKHYLTTIPITINAKETRLYQAGKPLAESYFAATSSPKNNGAALRPFVKDGQICLVLVYTAGEKIVLPQQAKKINEYTASNEFIRLYGYKLHINGMYYKVWLIESSQPEKKLTQPLQTILRRLRMNLLRIHAEKETVRILLNGIKAGLVPGSTLPANLATYLQKTAKKLFKKERHSLDQTDILSFALQSEDSLQPGEFTTLNENIESTLDRFGAQNVSRLLEKMLAQEKKLILLVSSSPTNKNPLNFGRELRQIEDVLERSADRGNYEIKPKAGVKKEELLVLLNQYRPHYLHITLHASSVEGLYFEAPDGEPAPISAEDFAEVLKTFSEKQRLEVIILSACHSAEHAKAVKPYCQHSVGMKAVFPDRASIVYAKGFYEMLFNDNQTDLPFCHKSAVLGIKQANPVFEAIKGTAVHDIPEFF